MANVKIEYTCGHGSCIKSVEGNSKEKARKQEWLEFTLVCPKCYREEKLAEDARAEKVASLVRAPSGLPTLVIYVEGQVEENKIALFDRGFQWSEIYPGGGLAYMTGGKPLRVLALHHRCSSAQDVKDWITEMGGKLAPLEYPLRVKLSDSDYEHLRVQFARQAERAKAIEADPPPPRPVILDRITGLEQTCNKWKRWNGKIYGRPGRYSFYVEGIEHTASDAEVAEYVTYTKVLAEWKGRHQPLVATASCHGQPW